MISIDEGKWFIQIVEASLPSQQKPLPPHVRFWGPPEEDLIGSFQLTSHAKSDLST
jgi:hypothetical protein